MGEARRYGWRVKVSQSIDLHEKDLSYGVFFIYTVLYIYKTVFIFVGKTNEMTMTNKVGSPVEGDDFFDRKAELAEAWDLLQNGNHLLISAPRRVGKTSLVRRLVRDAQGANWKALFINVEGEENEIGFVRLFVEGLKEQKNWFEKTKDNTFKTLSSLLQSLELEVKADDVGSMTVKWNQAKTADLKTQLLDLLRTMEDGLIVIDELPILLNRIAKAENGKQRAESFLHWLRSFRQLPGLRIRWVFCGSIGLDSFTERMGVVKTINDLYGFPLGAFTPKVADQFLERLGQDNSLPLSPAVRQEIVTLTGWPLPYYLQLLFSKLKSAHRIQGLSSVVTVEDVAPAFSKAAVHSNLGTWMERLDEQLTDEDARLAKGILDLLSRQQKGRKRSLLEQHLGALRVAPENIKDKATQLLKMLERDGYLLSQEGTYAFRSPLLRTYWFTTRLQ
ncbi:ATP-binding protein [Spirosoma fluviale]|uniref:AAA domain-containing protein n=1 Tax=Spirosoma fluviale TaxID=1597977 RepID=A0A286GS67_9BACT|nr:AAA family ATPase [Spirosoma fluviale]SOD98411.1 AAA domain-containing protein [Spirosoma fluviale]